MLSVGAVHHLDEPGAGVTVQVDGSGVDPAAHVVADGDHITVEVVTGSPDAGGGV